MVSFYLATSTSDWICQDYLLWNRLGSCLSNGSKPEEALGIYREALRLRPTYTRAIYNVGVACKFCLKGPDRQLGLTLK